MIYLDTAWHLEASYKILEIMILMLRTHLFMLN